MSCAGVHKVGVVAVNIETTRFCHQLHKLPGGACVYCAPFMFPTSVVDREIAVLRRYGAWLSSYDERVRLLTRARPSLGEALTTLARRAQ